MFSFMDLCGKPVAAADYIALCAHFHTLVLKGVPIFKGSNRQEGYRSAAPIPLPCRHILPHVKPALLHQLCAMVG